MWRAMRRIVGLGGMHGVPAHLFDASLAPAPAREMMDHLQTRTPRPTNMGFLPPGLLDTG